MIRKKLVRLSLVVAATLLSTLALTVPVNACWWVCDGGWCPPAYVHAYNSCNPSQKTCVTRCALP